MYIKKSESGQALVEYLLIMVFVGLLGSTVVVLLVAWLIDRFTPIHWWKAAIVLGIIALLNLVLGIRAKIKGFKENFGKSPMHSEPDSLLGTIQAFIHARTVEETRSIINQHPELLSEETDAYLRQLALAKENMQIRSVYESCRNVLRHIRELGIDNALGQRTPSRELLVLMQMISEPISPQERIDLCHRALKLAERSQQPVLWANIHFVLAGSLSKNLDGEKVENLEQAIFHYNQALQVYTRQSHPEPWALIHHNLGEAYGKRTQGTRAENLEQAIQHFRQALQVYTQQSHPELWASIQYNLANMHSGLRSKNG